MKAPPFLNWAKRRVAFSLVEVTIALGIFAFATVGILGLMPVAMNSARDSLDITVATQLANQIATGLRQSDWASLENGTSTTYFNETGNESTSAEATYQAVVHLQDSDSDNLKRAKVSLQRHSGALSQWNFCFLIFNQD